MGFLRLFLALVVVAFHSGRIFGWAGIGGAIAVQAFFMISGFYMGLVLDTKYAGPGKIKAFYVGRFYRIFAIYWPIFGLYLLAALAVFWTSGGGPLATVLRQGAGSLSFGLLALTNVTLFGLDLPLFLEFAGKGLRFSTDAVVSPEGLSWGIIVQPAWSLALELMFYLMVPFIVRLRLTSIAGIAVTCLVARAVAAYALGLSADPWSYRFFPFELSHFLAGVLAYKMLARRRASGATPLDYGLAAAVIVASVSYQAFGEIGRNAPYFSAPRLLYLGLVACALPGIFTISRRSRVDRWVGELSYPIYLLHMLAVALGNRVPLAAEWRGPAVVVGSLIGAIVFEVLIGRRLEEWRQALIARFGSPSRPPPAIQARLLPD